ncbi:MAG: penicillin acylase family protein [Deltaproteobacteria bacterium]|nr:penicillin acylase family protein [Deltaproteobacteria bacterium]
MFKLRKSSIVLLVLSVVIFLFITILLVFIINPWTKTNGKTKVKGLNNTVEIFRDKNGFPNIYAEDIHDLMFAQGFVHAQDRLWQMEMIRQLCRGQLSSFLGEKYIGRDKYFKTIGLHRVAEKSFSLLDNESRAYLQYYAEGVNEYINKFRHRLPIEYSITGLKPTPWLPEDSLIITNMLALNMGLNKNSEKDRISLIKSVGEDVANQLMLDFPEELTDSVLEATDVRQKTETLTFSEEYLHNFNVSWGSNNWVVHGSKTTTGKPFLVNDTHLGLSMPSVWYGNNLHMDGFEVGGFSVPGIPLVILGHNSDIFWGVTNLDPDVQDLYIEQVDNKENPEKYLFKGEYLEINKITEIIYVKGGSPVELEILFTHHGPFVEKVKNWEPSTLRWSLYDSSYAFKALIGLNNAENWTEFKEALRDWDGLHQNFVYADKAGNIGYQATGKVPIRSENHSGLLPVAGWDGKSEWQGYIPYDELPSKYNPPEGFITTANNHDVTGTDYPYDLALKYFPGFRVQRITDLLKTKEKLSIDDMKNIIGDTYSVAAERILPFLLETRVENEMQKRAIDYLKEWDLMLDVNSTAGAIYETWYYYLLNNIFRDELKESASRIINNTNFQKHVLLMENILQNPGNKWFDDTNTPEIEDFNDMSIKSLNMALVKLSELMGDDISEWRWGEIHKTKFKDNTLGDFLGFSNTEIEAEGGNSTINQALYVRRDPPFRVVHGTSQRLLMDVGNPDNSLVINSTGQNGNLFHPNRTDQTTLFKNMKFNEFSFTRQKVEENSTSRLILVSE